jgi:hypothetical protein
VLLEQYSGSWERRLSPKKSVLVVNSVTPAWNSRVHGPSAFGTLALPVDVRDSIKLYASKGVSARTGNSHDPIGVAWQYRWGGGL